MKAKRKKLAVWAVVAGVTLFFTGASARADGAPGKQALEGVWQVEVTILSDCGPNPTVMLQLPVLDTFTRDGKVIEAPGTPLSFEGLRTSPGLGTWEHEKGQQFSAVFRAFRINFDNTPAGSITFNEAIELSRDGDSFTSTGTADFFDTSGNLVAHACHTLAGTRLE